MSVKIEGLDQVLRNIERTKKLYEDAGGVGVYLEGVSIMSKSVPLVPVQYGVLRDSHYVAPPKSGKDPTCEIGYGTKYAVYVHERTELHHNVGQAKYLEQPLNEARSGYRERVKKRIQQAYNAEQSVGSTRTDMPTKPKTP